MHQTTTHENDAIIAMADEVIQHARDVGAKSAEGYATKAKRLAEQAKNDDDRRTARGFVAVARQAIIASCALFLASLAPVSANTPTFEQPVFPTAHYLAGCDILTFEDGSRLAECPDARLAYDSDGQMRPNAAGVPIRAPGWYVVSE